MSLHADREAGAASCGLGTRGVDAKWQGAERHRAAAAAYLWVGMKVSQVSLQQRVCSRARRKQKSSNNHPLRHPCDELCLFASRERRNRRASVERRREAVHTTAGFYPAFRDPLANSQISISTSPPSSPTATHTAPTQ